MTLQRRLALLALLGPAACAGSVDLVPGTTGTTSTTTTSASTGTSSTSTSSTSTTTVCTGLPSDAQAWGGGWPKVYTAESRYPVLRADAAGNLTVTTLRTPCGDAGTYVTNVAKLDPSGHPLWVRDTEAWAEDLAIGAAGETVLIGGFLEATSLFGGPVLAPDTKPGSSGSTGFVAKLDAKGQHVWSRAFQAEAARVAVDGAGNVIVLGRFWESTTIDGVAFQAQSAFLLLKLDAADGHTLWAKSLPYGAYLSRGQALAADAAGNVYFACGPQIFADFAGEPIIGGGLIKLGPDGAQLWSRDLLQNEGWAMPVLALAPGGDPILAGTFSDTLDVGAGPWTSDLWQRAFVARYDTAGQIRWGRLLSTISTGTSDDVWGVTATTSGDILVAGSFSGTMALGGSVPTLWSTVTLSAYVARLDGGGQPLGAARWSGTAEAMATAIAATGSGMALMGSFRGWLNLGTGPDLGSGSPQEPWWAFLTVLPLP
jgi:hypothetical protein